MSRARCALPILAATLAVALAGPSASQAAPAFSFQPQLGLPGSLALIGASPAQAPSEVWATASIGAVPATASDGQQVKDTTVLLSRAQQTSWQIVPVADEQGKELGFSGTPAVTEDGGLAMLSADASTILTRGSSGAFAQVPDPGTALEKGETLSGGFLAALDESAPGEAQGTGALVVPAGLSSSQPGVLHYDGSVWTREPICVQYAGTCSYASKLNVKALAVSSPQNAWLLATGSGGALLLFKRIIPSGSPSPVWVQDQPASWAPMSGDLVSARTTGQMLTVTSQGVWVDAVLHTPAVSNADFSLLLDSTTPSTVLGTWCYPQAEGCHGSLGEHLPEDYASFAWTSGGGLGTRIIAGLEGGALLRFQGGGSFEYLVGGGGNASPDVVFSSPEEGWIVSGAFLGAQLERVTTNPEPSALGATQAWPLPFRRPLLAITTQPGTTPGDPNAEALAAGDQGQIARYLPGQGWIPEFLYNAAGRVQTPRLRGVAWPEADRAYAVGDEGAMWLWRSETDLWEPDPAEPLDFHANLTAIAFSPIDPALGYAVGKQGTLLAYDKTWTQQTLPPGLEQVNFTSVAFAGAEALATYRLVEANGAEVGGLMVNDGSGWKVETGTGSAQALLAGLPKPTETVLSKVAGLPDGGAVAAGPGIVIERDSASSPWRFSRQPLPEAQNIAALAAFSAGSEVRALVSIDLDPLSEPNNEQEFIRKIDDIPPPVAGQPAGLVGPDPLPVTGYLLSETAEGWQDLEQQAYPGVSPSPSLDSDLPNWPSAVLALDVNPSGTEGWVVGGQTAGIIEASTQKSVLLTTQTASALHLGGGATSPQSAGAPILTPAEEAASAAAASRESEKKHLTSNEQEVFNDEVTFAVGGNAQCAGPCADLANEGPGPGAWLSGAVSRAAQIPSLDAFLYTGARVAEGAGQSLSPEAFTRELQAYADDLSSAGSLPVRVAASPSDVDHAGDLSTFTSDLGGDAPSGSVPTGTPPPPAGSSAYVFERPGKPVRVIVLDYAASTLPPGELAWLEEQLEAAKVAGVPAIVMGNADIVDPSAPHHAGDATAVQRALITHGASAYLFDSPGQNRATQIGSGVVGVQPSNAISAFGTGTLGYVPPPVRPEEFLGASGFLLVSVNIAQRNSSTNRAPVSVKLTPDISQLALDPTDGTLLRRSQVALFQALARRPAGGLEEIDPGNAAQLAPDPYVPIPETCIGAGCNQFLAPEYTFSSSRPDIGNFVAPEPNSLNPRAVLQGSNGLPIADPHSGLFCAFNPGTTTVSITTGGLTYSMPVIIQAGSVEQPCGTVPLRNPPVAEVSASAPVAALPPSTPPASSPTPLSVTPPPPAPLPVSPHVAPPPLARAVPAPPAFFAGPPAIAGLVGVPLLAPPVLARPIPPSGAAPVTVVSPAVAPEEKRETEEAIESARNSMAAYYSEEPSLPPTSLIALIVLAAGAGVGVRRATGSRRNRRAPAFARARTRRY